MAKLELKVESEISHIEVNVVIKNKVNKFGGSEYPFTTQFLMNLTKEDFETMLSYLDSTNSSGSK